MFVKHNLSIKKKVLLVHLFPCALPGLYCPFLTEKGSSKSKFHLLSGE